MDKDQLPDDITDLDFIVPASDIKGHSSRFWGNMQPALDRQISVIVNSKWFPYKSKGDLIRHAIQRHLHWLETLAPFPSVMGQVDAILELVRDEQFNSEFADAIVKLTDQVARYVATNQLPRAKSLVIRVMDKIQGMPEGAWKDQYVSEIETKFGHYLSGKSVNLLD